MKQFKYKTSFSSVVKCIIDEERSKFLSQASIEELRGIIPKEALNSGKEDLLPIAGNLAVINLMNLNGDAMDTETIIKVSDSLFHKPINIEHNRGMIIGHVVNVGFSKFNSSYKIGVGSEILGAEDVKNIKKPFNLSYSAYLYKLINEEIIEKIIESSDPTSQGYLGISSSWEVGFDSYSIAVGSTDLENAQIITSEDEKAAFEPYLKSNGGKGKLEDGRYVYRVIQGTPIFIGAGLTQTPAGAVSGLITHKIEEVEVALTETVAEEEKVENLISQIENNNVKEYDNMKTITTLDEIKALKQEDLKEVAVASIAETIYNEMKRVSEDWTKKVQEKEQSLEEVKKLSEKTIVDLQTVSKELNEIKELQAKAEAEKQFNTRMAYLDESFELDEDQRKAVASDINGLSEEDFGKWLSKFEILAKKSKKSKKEVQKEEQKSVASVKEETEKQQEVVEKVLDSAVEQKETIANSTTSEVSDIEKYRKHFSLDGLKIS